MADPKPLAEMAREWLETWIWGFIDQANHRDKKFPGHVEATASLTALLERVASDASKARDGHWVEVLGFEWAGGKGNTPETIRREYEMGQDDDDKALADAQKEVERLKAELQLAETSGDAIMEIRASIKEQFGIEAAFFDDVIALALQQAREEGRREQREATRPLVEALRFVRDAFVYVDNGYCSVCRGYWPNEHRKECISTMVRSVLAAHEERTPPQPQAGPLPLGHFFHHGCPCKMDYCLERSTPYHVYCGQPKSAHKPR